MRTDWDVIVVGGGLAGLAAGATAATAGASTVVLEGHRPGGRARTIHKSGFVFNMGGHALYLGGPGTMVLRTLGVQPDGLAPPLDRYQVLQGGRLHLLPHNPGSLLRTTALNRRGKAQFAKLLGLLPLMTPVRLAGLSVQQWLDDRGLRSDVAGLVRALIRISTYNADVDQFSAEAAVGQMQIAGRPGVIYLNDGWTQLVQGLSRLVEVRAGCKVIGVAPAAGRIEVETADGVLVGRRVVLAPGSPEATRSLLPADPRWPELGPPVTAACLDVGAARIPDPGYVLGVDDPVYGTTQSPPARQAPAGQAVVAVIRYGATTAEDDRSLLERHLTRVGVHTEDIVASRFLARMTVAASFPRAETGGLAGRPEVTATGLAGVLMAGDWVGPAGLLADASLASGHDAARRAVQSLDQPGTLVA